MQELHIAAKELIPIIIGAVVWGKTWKGSKVCDNSAVVAVVNRHAAKINHATRSLTSADW